MSASGAVRPAWRRRRVDLRRIVTHDFPLKATALLIALLLVVANAQSAAPRVITVAFDGRVPVERPDVPEGYVLRGALGDVGVTLRGPEGVADRVAVTDLRATIDAAALDRARSEAQEAKVVVTVANVTVANEGVQVVDVSPATVAVRLERVTARTLSVQARYANEPPSGSRPGDASISPTEVKVNGPESDVGRVAAVYATVRFGDAMTDVTVSAPAIPVDAAGQPVDGLQVEPGVVVVTVPVLPTATTRTVPVAFVGRGTVAPGYWVSSVTTDPVAVTVRGEESRLATLDRVETAAVDVSGLSATRTVRVRLALPEGVTLVRDTDVSVTLTVQPLTGTRPFLVAVEVTGLGAGLVAEADPPTVQVVVSGPLPALAALGAEQVSATVDASGRGAGTHSLEVSVRAPSAVTVQSVQPARVTLTIRPR